MSADGYVELRATYQRAKLWSESHGQFGAAVNLLLDRDRCRFRVVLDPEDGVEVELWLRFPTIGWTNSFTWPASAFEGDDLEVILDAAAALVPIPDDAASLL